MKNVLEFLEKTAPVCGDKTAFSDGEENLSFAELAQLSRAGGSALITKGLKNEPVAVFMKKAPKTIAAFFAVLYAGCYYVPLDASMPLYRLQMIFEQLSPRAVICDDASRELAETLRRWQLFAQNASTRTRRTSSLPPAARAFPRASPAATGRL